MPPEDRRDPESTYELAPQPQAPPALPGAVRFKNDTEDVRDMLSSDLLARALASVGDSGTFHLALALREPTERLLMKLMVDPKYRAFPWEATHVWSVHEPLAHPEDPSHSAPALRELLVEPSGMPPENLHAVHAHLPDACERASAEMIDSLRARGPGRDKLDAVLVTCEPEFLVPHEDPAGRIFGHTPGPDPAVTLSTRVVLDATLIAVLAATREHWETAASIQQGSTGCAYTERDAQLRWYFHPLEEHAQDLNP